MHPTVTDFKNNAQSAVNHLKEDLKTIRTGRANPSLIENISVETYGGSTKLQLRELSTITTDGPSLLVVHPFDPSTVQDIERAIQKSPLNLTPATQGNIINVRIPPLTQEQREKYVKMISQKIEERKVQVRGQRDDARRKLRTLFDTKEITEDQKFRIEKEIDTANGKIMDEIQDIKDKKEQELMEV